MNAKLMIVTFKSRDCPGVHKVIQCLVAGFVTKCACCCFAVYFASKTRVNDNFGILYIAYDIQIRETAIQSMIMHL